IISELLEAPTSIGGGALKSRWTKANVWVHGDIAVGNLLVKDGKFGGVIDFGMLGIGDPALGCDKDTWSRARGDSASSGKLFNVSVVDYAPTLKKARVSVGNVPVGIYRQGPRDQNSSRRKPQSWHNQTTEPEIFKVFQQVRHNGNYYASVRNFFAKMVMNFGINDLFLCLTINNQQKNLQFRRSP
ncbi:23676_t:CDS:2, partial [Racocetra persica]